MVDDATRLTNKDISTGVLVTTAIFCFSVIIPVVGVLLYLFTPLPVMLYRLKLGRKAGAFVLAASTLAAYLLLSLIGSGGEAVFFIQFGVLGWAAGEVLDRNGSIELAVSLPVLAVIGLGVVLLVAVAMSRSTGPYQLLTTYVDGQVKETLSLYQSMGVDVPDQNMAQIKTVMLAVFPGLTIVGLGIVSFLNLMVARRLSAVFKIPFPEFGSLNNWRPPEYLVWPVIGAGFTLVVPGLGLAMIGLNIFLIASLIYLLAGLAIVAYFFQQKEVPRFMRVFGYTLIALTQLVTLAVILIGFIDTWIDFRKPRNQEES
ncbi:MAG: DUF2232 domain-containing protein [Deltaproteobacteria bacterium]|nr:DUF2232 domain-containing protein [Deltaproteobacteria bacterium]